MKGYPEPLAHRQVVSGADKAHGPRKEVADLKLPNEPKAKGETRALDQHWLVTPAAAVMESTRRSLESPEISHMENPSKLFWMMNFPLAANDCGSS